MRQPHSKSMRDVRTLRSLSSRSLPSEEGDTYLQLYRLAAEKHRLEREAEMWLRKKDQIERRLGEIEQQMELLQRSASTVEAEVRSPRRAWKQVTLEY